MDDYPVQRNWASKFRDAFRGIVVGVVRQKSFYVQLPMAIAVVAIALFLKLDAIRLSILLVCVAFVLTAELFNSCLECLAKAITRDADPDVGDALDIGAGAVLTASIFAAVVGLLMLLPPVIQWISGN